MRKVGRTAGSCSRYQQLLPLGMQARKRTVLSPGSEKGASEKMKECQGLPAAWQREQGWGSFHGVPHLLLKGVEDRESNGNRGKEMRKRSKGKEGIKKFS